jgi:dimethylamine/trimethylamine dehydrogenase
MKSENNINLQHIELIGDALAPGLIADAIYSGHLAAENFEEPEIHIQQALYAREITSLI